MQAAPAQQLQAAGAGEEQLPDLPAPGAAVKASNGDAEISLPAGVGTQSDARASLSLSHGAKSQIKASMEKLRRGIEHDFDSTTDMGQQAGYLPPPGE